MSGHERKSLSVKLAPGKVHGLLVSSGRDIDAGIVMNEQRVVTVVLCTYNRARMLGAALDRLLAQSAGSPAYEVLLVDNNSSDDTRRVAERYTSSRAGPVQYLFEPRQGVVHARNTGIAAARSDIIAFTDDDVWVTEDWVEVIKRAFDAHPEVDGLGGRTLPIWPSDPPAWLTRRHWVGPLALQDYGDKPLTVDARRPLCLAGANCAYRKAVFARLGAFSPEFERSEDTEFLLRLWRSGGRALYVPDMKVFAAVQPERLTKRYHREWHTNIGRCNARMQLSELTAADGSIRSEAPPLARLVGVPRFAVRQLANEVLEWCKATARRSESEAFWHETQARTLVEYMRESRARFLQRSRGWS
jgi:glucosyl-dolichyl phosphate glucuronosyltransferase